MIFGAIVAGGIGKRMGISDVPKQFMMLGSKPIIIHTIEKFLLCSKIDFLYVGVHKDWIYYTEDLVKKHLINCEKLIITEGGIDRNLTIMNIIDAIESNHEISDEDIIVTHDAVRPFLTLKMIEENIKAAIEHGACDTVTPTFDTIIESENGEAISFVPERKKLFLGQTPQSFKIKLLKNIYNSLNSDEKAKLTDACSIFVLKNKLVKLVSGAGSNIKITTEIDYKIAKSMIESMSESSIAKGDSN